MAVVRGSCGGLDMFGYDDCFRGGGPWKDKADTKAARVYTSSFQRLEPGEGTVCCGGGGPWELWCLRFVRV